MKRWRADTESTLGEVLVRVFDDPTALADGRVFVARTRVQDAHCTVAAGTVVEVGQAVARAPTELAILHEESEFVVVDKPAGLVSVPDHHGHDSLQARVAAHCKLPLERVHPTSRLDRGVSGVVVFALDKSARDAFASAREHAAYSRLYLGLAEHTPSPAEGTWTWPIGRHPKDPRKRSVVAGKEPVHASTAYRVGARAPHGILFELRPHTGRTHQLRVHAAHAGCALDGDSAYGGRARIVSERGDILTWSRVALHAACVELPWKGRPQRFVAPLPAALSAAWQALGGSSLEEYFTLLVS